MPQLPKVEEEMVDLVHQRWLALFSSLRADPHYTEDNLEWLSMLEVELEKQIRYHDDLIRGWCNREGHHDF